MAFADGLRPDSQFLSPGLGVLAELLGVAVDLGKHPLRCLPSRSSLLGDQPLAFVQLDLPLRRLLVELGGPSDEGLLDVVSVRLSVPAGTLEERRRFPRSGRANLGRLVFGHPEKLLHPVPEALLSIGVLAGGRMRALLFKLGPSALQLCLSPNGSLVLTLMRLHHVVELAEEGPHLVLDLSTIITTPREIKNMRLG